MSNKQFPNRQDQKFQKIELANPELPLHDLNARRADPYPAETVPIVPPPYYHEVPDQASARNFVPQPPIDPYALPPSPFAYLRPRPVMTLSTVKMVPFVIWFILIEVGLGLAYGGVKLHQQDEMEKKGDTLTLFGLILNSVFGLVYLLMNAAIWCRGPQNYDIKCYFLFLLSQDGEAQNCCSGCCAGCCLALLLNLIFLPALIGFIIASSKLNLPAAQHQVNGGNGPSQRDPYS